MRKTVYKYLAGLAMIIVFMLGTTMCVSAEEAKQEVKTTLITARYSGSIKLGSEIDKSRFTIVAYYTDETSRILEPDEFEISPTTIQEIGNNAVNVSYTYNGDTATINATVVGRTPCNLSKIEATYTGGTIVSGDFIDRGDVKVMAHYGDGTSAEVDTWHFANYIITDGLNIVYVVYTEDGYTRNCPIRINGKTLAEKQLVKIVAEYTGDDVTAGHSIDKKDVQVSAYFKYISTVNTVTTSMEGIDDWYFGSYDIDPGTNVITIWYQYGSEKVSTTIEVEGLDYEGNWVTYNGFYRFQNNDGTYKTNEWYEEGGYYYHFNDAGNADVGWNDIDDDRYYFDKHGRMCTDWQKIRNIWYYFEDDGELVMNDWVKDGIHWYYMQDDGSMAESCWIKDGREWYYLSGNGIMATGWFYDSGKWYFLTRTGAMATDWCQIGPAWYYFDDDGVMLADKWIGNHYVDINGVWTASR